MLTNDKQKGDTSLLCLFYLLTPLYHLLVDRFELFGG